MTTNADLEREAEWLNKRYAEVTGSIPNPPVGLGVSNLHVEYVRSVIFRSVIQSLDKIVAAAMPNFKCGVCGTTDPNFYQRCQHPGCPDGR